MRWNCPRLNVGQMLCVLMVTGLSLANSLSMRESRWPTFADLFKQKQKTEVKGTVPSTTDVHVVYSTDPGGYIGLLSSMLSLSYHLTEPEHCYVHLIVGKEDMAHASQLVDCFRHEMEINKTTAPTVLLHEFRPIRFDASRNLFQNILAGKDHAFARFYLPEYFPDVERVIYLDYDTIVRTDIGALYRMPMEHGLAGVLQMGGTYNKRYIKVDPDVAKYVKDPESWIINTGMVVMDLARWRTGNVTQSLEEWTTKFNAGVSDQLVLNLEFKEKRGFDELPIVWNLYNLGTEREWDRRLVSAAKILHWSGGWKPWEGMHNELYQSDFAPYVPRDQCGVLPTPWTAASFRASR